MTDDATDALVRIVHDRVRAEGAPLPVVLGIGGGVGVGKTTLATAIADRLRERGVTTAVVATDNFLLPNAELDRRGRLMQKGFPDTYDVHAIAGMVATLKAGRTAVVPVYSHQSYDRTDDTLAVAPTQVLIVEGVNVLQPEVDAVCDVSVYVDVDEQDARQWFFDRFDALCEVGEGFYAAFASMDAAQRRSVAESAWFGINRVNLEEHITPTRARADYVLRKAADHSTVELIPR